MALTEEQKEKLETKMSKTDISYDAPVTESKNVSKLGRVMFIITLIVLLCFVDVICAKHFGLKDGNFVNPFMGPVIYETDWSPTKDNAFVEKKSVFTLLGYRTDVSVVVTGGDGGLVDRETGKFVSSDIGSHRSGHFEAQVWWLHWVPICSNTWLDI